MQTYYMLGRYTENSVKNISATRTNHVARIVEELGGEIILMNALLGEYDLALIVNFPGNIEIFKASLAITKATGITFVSFPAITVSELDQLADGI